MPPSAAPFPTPGCIYHTRLEALLASPGEAEKLLDPAAPACGWPWWAATAIPWPCAGPWAPPRTCLAWDNCQVFLFVRDAKVAAPDMEAILEEASERRAHRLSNCRELPALSLDGELPRLTFFDPVMHEEESLPCDLVILDEAQQPAPGNASLAELLGLFPGPAGFLQADNVRNLPVITNRRGIYVAGPGRGVVDLDQAFFEADAAVSEVQQLLGRGTAPAPQGRAVIDRGRCVLCLTCHRVCPHGAVTWDNRAIINELACQGCGVCASQCPNEAIQIHNFTDDQVIAAMNTLDPRLTPKIVAFMCKNSAWEAYHAALQMDERGLALGLHSSENALRRQDRHRLPPPGLYPGGRRGPGAGLPSGQLQVPAGNEHALWRVERARDMLAEAGVDPRRLVFKTLAANSPRGFPGRGGPTDKNLETVKAA